MYDQSLRRSDSGRSGIIQARGRARRLVNVPTDLQECVPINSQCLACVGGAAQEYGLGKAVRGVV